MKIIKILPLLMVAGLSLVGCKGVGDVDNVKKTGLWYYKQKIILRN